MLNKTLNFIKFGFKLTKQKLKPLSKFNLTISKPKLTPAKSIAFILFLATYGLTISFLINIIEAQGVCSTHLECSGTTLTDLAIDDKLGIGTASPNKQLHIKTASGNAELDIQSGSNNHWGIYQVESGASAYNGDLRFWNSDDRITFTDDGKVGIGTMGPSYELDVVGTINASTDIKVNGTSVLTSYNDTNASTICSGGNVLDGNGNCVANYDGYAPNTNASTICSGGNVLNGSGSCVANYDGIRPLSVAVYKIIEPACQGVGGIGTLTTETKCVDSMSMWHNNTFVGYLVNP